MKFLEAIEELKKARAEGRELSFECGAHWMVGVNEFFFWWEYVCCESDECPFGEFEEYETAAALVADKRDFDGDWR